MKYRILKRGNMNDYAVQESFFGLLWDYVNMHHNGNFGYINFFKSIADAENHIKELTIAKEKAACKKSQKWKVVK